MPTLSDKYTPFNKSLTYPDQEDYPFENFFNTDEEGYNFEEIQRYLLDALGASVWQDYPETFAYRWRGEDTLTWGNLGNWLHVEWVRKSFRKTLNTRFLDQYKLLKEIINTTGSYELQELYEYRNSDAVVRYLQSHPQLINFLQESHYYLLKHFESTSKFALEVIHDPEAQHQQLIVYINTPMSVDEALNRLDKLDTEWFLDHINSVGHLINFNLEII